MRFPKLTLIAGKIAMADKSALGAMNRPLQYERKKEAPDICREHRVCIALRCIKRTVVYVFFSTWIVQITGVWV